jgi:glutamate/tyrosine decarboxylase-like PLP-dependent enzyme
MSIFSARSLASVIKGVRSAIDAARIYAEIKTLEAEGAEKVAAEATKVAQAARAEIAQANDLRTKAAAAVTAACSTGATTP